MATGVEAAIISVAGKAVAAVLPEALKKIEEILKKRKGVGDEVDTLSFKLSTIQSFILGNRKIIRSQSATSQELRIWTANLRCFAYDMEDYIEGYRAKTITGVELYDKITKLRGSVEQLNTDLEKFMNVRKALNPPSDEGGATASTSSAPSSSNPQRQRDPGFLLTDRVGEVEYLRELLDLNTLSATNLKVIVISVVGFGGIGKTNLCRQEYNNGMNQFSRHAFVSAAGKDRNEVLVEIILRFLDQESAQDGNGGNANVVTKFINGLLGRLTPHRIIRRLLTGEDVAQDDSDGNLNASAQVRLYMNELAERLRANRYCIVVDDVGSEEMGKLIASFFPENNMGSRIIIGMAVVGSTADSCNGQYNESVNLFQNEVVEEGRQHRFQIVGPRSRTSLLMLMMPCDGGVPLALVSISEVLRLDDVDEAWRQFRTEEAARMAENVYRVLPHGYDSLHPPADRNYMNLYIPEPQACLLYFALFPRGNHIKRGSLIRRWLAEGKEFGGGSIDNAAGNLNLIDQNFIRPLHVSQNQEQHANTCQPPDVVHSFITDMSKEEDFIMLSCAGACSPNYIRRLSLHPTVVRNSVRRNPTNDDDLPPRLRTLAVSCITNVDGIVKCERLRVLDLEEYAGLKASELEEICNKLKLLKYLSLRAGIISMVPSSIKNLQLLETLDLGQETNDPVGVPIEVIQLPCLKHLLGKFELKDHKYKIPNRILPVPKQIKKSKLERLAGFSTSKGQGFPPLMCHMEKLWKVKIWFKCDADAKSLETYLRKAITRFLGDNNIDRTLSLCFADSCPSPGKLLDSLAEAEASRWLYSLKLCGKNLSEFPEKFVSKLTGITKLCLSCWASIKLDATFLGELSKLNQLKYLKLDAVRIQGVCDTAQAGNAHEKVVIETRHIEKVERMCLVAKSALPEIETKPTALEKLDSLHLISEDIYCPSANVIRKAHGQAAAPLAKLKEVVLNVTVAKQTKKNWYKATRDHHNCPRILFIEHPRPRRSG